MPKALPLPDSSKTVLRGLRPSGRYLVGVSGGRDSVALIHWLRQAGFSNLIVCHLNHQLRGRSSVADAKFVEKLAGDAALDVVIGVADVKALASRHKLSIESAARLARHTFFGRTARRHRCRTVLLAHHADDLVETFLINLLRGTGSAGLASIQERSELKVGDVTLELIRPLLAVWRTDIDQYVKEHQLRFRDDASNKDLGPFRNRIRHRVIPYLEKTAGREIRQSIWRTALILAEEQRFLSSLVPEMNGDPAGLSLKTLHTMSVALQRRTLQKWLRSANVANVGFDVVERVRGLLDVASGVAKTNLPGDRHVRRRAGKLSVE